MISNRDVTSLGHATARSFSQRTRDRIARAEDYPSPYIRGNRTHSATETEIRETAIKAFRPQETHSVRSFRLRKVLGLLSFVGGALLGGSLIAGFLSRSNRLPEIPSTETDEYSDMIGI